MATQADFLAALDNLKTKAIALGALNAQRDTDAAAITAAQTTGAGSAAAAVKGLADVADAEKALVATFPTPPTA